MREERSCNTVIGSQCVKRGKRRTEVQDSDWRPMCRAWIMRELVGIKCSMLLHPELITSGLCLHAALVVVMFEVVGGYRKRPD